MSDDDDSDDEAASQSDGEESEDELFKVRKTVEQEDEAGEEDSSRGDFAAAVIHDWSDEEVSFSWPAEPGGSMCPADNLLTPKSHRA